MHRSGTTWVGRMLTASRQAVYFHEPLNPEVAPMLLKRPVETQYLYLSEDNEDGYPEAFTRLLGIPLGTVRAEPIHRQRPKRLARLLHARLTRARPLLKDPFALFSIPWFVKRLGATVVVVVRHPLAIAGSTKRLAWGFDTSWLLRQPLLMRDRLEPFRRALEAQPITLIGQAALLWRILYETAGEYARELPQVHVVRHEDLSRNPLREFERLYATLGLEFSHHAAHVVSIASEPGNPIETRVSEPGEIRLDSRANLDRWKERLTGEEIELVRSETDELARTFYS